MRLISYRTYNVYRWVITCRQSESGTRGVLATREHGPGGASSRCQVAPSPRAEGLRAVGVVAVAAFLYRVAGT